MVILAGSPTPARLKAKPANSTRELRRAVEAPPSSLQVLTISLAGLPTLHVKKFNDKSGMLKLLWQRFVKTRWRKGAIARGARNLSVGFQTRDRISTYFQSSTNAVFNPVIL